jgi:ribosome-binding factor A
MHHKRTSTKKLQSLSDSEGGKDGVCGEIHPEDGLDPAEFFRPARKRDNSHRKTKQLCHQVAQTLSLALGDFDNELRELRIVSVTPAPDATQLLVIVAPSFPGVKLDADSVSAKLAFAEGRLRSEVAAAITRKKAPRLLFQFVEGSGFRPLTSDF